LFNTYARFAATELTRPIQLTIVFIWSILQEKVYGTRFTNVDKLKCKLFREWAKLDHEIIASAIRQWRRRLRACETADGGHFEQAF